MSLKESLKPTGRASLSHQFISGVYSSCILKIILKMRKNFEFLMETLEEIEKCYFKNNNQNFLHVSKEYEYLVRSFGSEYDKNQKSVISMLLETELIRPLSELSKGRKKFEKEIFALIQKLKEKHNFCIEEDNFEHDSSNFIHLKSNNWSSKLESVEKKNNFKNKNLEIMDSFSLKESYDTNVLIQNEIRKEASELLKIQKMKEKLDKELNETLDMEKIQSTCEFSKLDFGYDTGEAEFEAEEGNNTSRSSEVYMTRELSSCTQIEMEKLRIVEDEKSFAEKELNLEIFNFRKIEKNGNFLKTDSTKEDDDDDEENRTFENRPRKLMKKRDVISINDLYKISNMRELENISKRQKKTKNLNKRRSPVQEIQLFGTDYKASINNEEEEECPMDRNSLKVEIEIKSNEEIQHQKKLQRAFVNKENYNASNVDLLSLENIPRNSSPKKGFPNLLKSAENTSRDYDYETEIDLVKGDYITFNAPISEKNILQEKKNQNNINIKNDNNQINQIKEMNMFKMDEIKKRRISEMLRRSCITSGINSQRLTMEEGRKYSQARSDLTTTTADRRSSNLTTNSERSERSELVINHNQRNLMNLLKTCDEDIDENSLSPCKRKLDRSVELTKCSSKKKVKDLSISMMEKGRKKISKIWGENSLESVNYKKSPIRVVTKHMTQSKAAEFFNKKNGGSLFMKKPNLLLESEDY